MSTSPGRLEGKVVVFTGAGGGIGLSAVRRFVAEGARVVAVDISDRVKQATADLGDAVACFIRLAGEVDTTGADALVISACVQMPSLRALAEVQRRSTIPVVSAASATVWKMLRELGLDPVVPEAGALLGQPVATREESR